MRTMIFFFNTVAIIGGDMEIHFHSQFTVELTGIMGTENGNRVENGENAHSELSRL